MPSITAAISDLSVIGPVLDLQVAVPPPVETLLREANEEVPAPIPASLMIDTGASNTVIQSGIAQKLGLKPVGTLAINTPSGAGIQCFQYSLAASQGTGSDGHGH